MSDPHTHIQEDKKGDHPVQEKDNGFFGRNKMVILQWLYVVSAIITIVIPFNIHHPTACNDGHSSLPFIHTTWWLTFNWGTLTQPFEFSYRSLEIWEVFALLQVMAFSSIVIWEPDEREMRTRKIVLTMVGIIAICLFGIGLLGKHRYNLYQIATIVILLIFLAVDFHFYKRTGNAKYKFLCLFVDLPLVAAIVTLNFYVHFPIAQEYFHFYSGAIAFQLMVGNLLIFIIGLYVETVRHGGFLTALKENFIPKGKHAPAATGETARQNL